MLAGDTRRALEQRYYPRLEAVVFGRLAAELGARLRPGAVVLDVGSGPGSWVLRAYRPRLGLLLGVDVYVPAERNLDAFVLACAERLPLATASVDLVMAYLVIEHLADPQTAFREWARVLKPGGYLCLKTPAVRTPLFLLSQSLPTTWHRRLKRRIGTAEADVFPTYYRANTLPELERQLVAAGLQREALYTVDQTYAYLTQARWAYALGLLYSRLTEQTFLAGLRNQIIALYRRPSEAA